MQQETALKKQAREIKRIAFLAESDWRYAKATADTDAIAAAENKLRQAQAEHAVVIAALRDLKKKKKQEAEKAEKNRAITVADLNAAVTKILSAVAALQDSSSSLGATRMNRRETFRPPHRVSRRRDSDPAVAIDRKEPDAVIIGPDPFRARNAPTRGQ